MNSSIAHILLNFMFIAIPFLLVIKFSVLARNGRLHPATIAFSAGLSIAGCMAFPFEFSPGHTCDLRLVPLATSVLYGGLPAGAGLSAAILVMEGLSDGGSMSEQAGVGSLIMYLITILSACGVRNRLLEADWPRKWLWCLLLAALLYAARATGLAAAGKVLPWDAAMPMLILQSAVLLFVVAFSEQVRESIMRLKEQVRKEKLTANRSLAVIIAHELRNPLTTVNGFLQLIKEKQPSEQIMNYVQTAMQELSEAEKIIRTYLSITAMQEAGKTRVSVSSCFDAALAQLWDTIEQKGIDLVNAVSEDIHLYCNEEQLRLCLLHLLRNSVNALDQGGRLAISSFWKGKELAIVVSDNGIGMTEEQLEQLGLPKYNTRSSGTGTGLMYCYHFVHSMDGRLHIQSQPGRGTTVTVTFPASRTDEPQY